MDIRHYAYIADFYDWSALAPESSKQGGAESFRGARGERRTRDTEGVKFEALRVEMPKAWSSRRRGVENGEGLSPSPAD